MLIEDKKLPYIRIFKLFSGEEIVTTVTQDHTDELVIEKPLQLVNSGHGVTFAPVMFMVNLDRPVKLKKIFIGLEGLPSEQVEAQYRSAISGIAVPKKSTIIT